MSKTLVIKRKKYQKPNFESSTLVTLTKKRGYEEYGFNGMGNALLSATWTWEGY